MQRQRNRLPKERPERMDADWSVECAGDDPLVAVPWQNADGTLTFVDLRSELPRDPEVLLQIPEARQYPAIAAALGRWNHATSPLFTAKCDVWSYPAHLFDAEDLPGFAFARGSDVDFIPLATETFQHFPAAELQLRRWKEMAASIPAPDARCEWILRRAMLAPEDAKECVQYRQGYAATLYVWGYGGNEESAATAWEFALTSLIEPTLAAAAATIEP